MDQDTLIQAINTGKVLDIIYGGGRRLIEPFTFGRLLNGKKMLRAFQTEGYSESGKPFGWKLFEFDKIEDGSDSGGSFNGPRPGYNPNDSVMRGGIIATY
jgi:hypothetical protein